MKDFYMTLLSNSSMDYYRNNKTSSFSVQLPRYIRLEGEWEVGLAEIQHPYTFHTVLDGYNEIHLKMNEVTPEFKKWVSASKDKKITDANVPVESVTCKIASGFYSDVNDIVTAVNGAIKKESGVPDMFTYDSKTKIVTTKPALVKAGEKFIQSCTLSERLGLQLGYPPLTDVCAKKNAPYVSNIAFGVPDKMIIYCDIVEPQIFGDNFARVLTTVHTLPEGKVTFAKTFSTYFTVPQYIPVQMKEFATVSIDIRDVEGNLMPFQYGTLTVKLHLRKVQRN